MARYFLMSFLIGLTAYCNAQSQELKEKICKECFGSGICLKCEGRGWVKHHCIKIACNKVSDNCPDCEGNKKCKVCNGSGMNIPKEANICFCNGFGIELRCIECSGDPLDCPHFYQHHFCSICSGKGYVTYLKKGKEKRKKCSMCHGNVAYIKPAPLCHHMRFRHIKHEKCKGKGYVYAR